MSDDDLSGLTLGNFRIVRRIGGGATGVVYEAIESSLRRTVALKILPAAPDHDPEQHARLLREARAAAVVHHPCVATIFQVGTATLEGRGELSYLAMELVVGTSLRERMARERLAVGQAIDVARHIARGLEGAHQVGVVHRDLRPENVMLTTDGSVKILDFGRPRLAFESSEYMAPEQARGEDVDGRADLFSLGVVLYELLAGRRPFETLNAPDERAARARDAYPEVSSLRPEVPRALDAVIDRCLAKEASARFSNATELIVALSAIPRPTVTVEPPATVAPALTRPPRYRRRTAAMALGGALVAAGLVLLGVTLTRDERTTDRSHPTPDGQVMHAADGEGAGPITTPPSFELPVGTVVACPVLEVFGAEAPGGWLGAAAATLACERATIFAGGPAEHTRIPAELLGLPSEPVDDYARDPYAADDARARSLDAARRVGAWIDGWVRQHPDDFEVELFVARAGARSESVHGRGVALHVAVRDAIDRLVEARVLPRVERLDPQIADWMGVVDLDTALLAQDLIVGVTTGVGTHESLQALVAARARVGRFGDHFMWVVHYVLPDAPPGPIPVDDRTTPARHMYSLLTRAMADPAADRGAIADELASMRAASTDPLGRIPLINAEVAVRALNGEVDVSRHLALRVAASAPRDAEWMNLVGMTYRTAEGCAVAHTAAAWFPREAGFWQSLVECATSPEEAERYGRRSIAMGPGFVQWSVMYAEWMLMRGKPMRARSAAARLHDKGPEQAVAADVILAHVDMAEMHFGAALERAKEALLSRPAFGSTSAVDSDLLMVTDLAGAILGRRTELADAIALRFVLPEAHRIAPGQVAVSWLAATCAWASQPIAQRCLARLRDLLASGFFISGGSVEHGLDYLAAAERFVARDLRGTVEAARPALKAPFGVPDFIVIAFDEVWDHATASLLDDKLMAKAARSGGVNLAHVREAKRACGAKDFTRCRELAERVIQTWSLADTKVLAVDEMRALIATIPSR